MVNSNVELVLRYFDACNTGEVDELKATLADDVVHYFLPPEHPPIHGADHLSNYWRKFHQRYNPAWRIDHIIGAGDEVVSEWSCAYTRPRDGRRMMFRGSEWYVVVEGRITEVRAYYRYDDSMDCELAEFPYAERGYLAK